MLIFSSKEEPNSLFGGMAVPEWESLENKWISDPVDKSSWLFKIELEGKQLSKQYLTYINRVKLHQWKCIFKENAINCDKSYFMFYGKFC